MGRRRKNNKGEGAAKAPVTDPEVEAKNAPHTFIINRGVVGKNVNCLIQEMRRVMEPYTASKLKVREKNSLKDFLSIAGVLNVTHMMLFSKSESGTNIRILRTPRGPTLTFRVKEYTLAKDVISSLRRPNMEPKQFKNHPLLVMNNFSGEGREIQLMATVFQNMFPSINVNKVRLSSIRRCVLFNYNQEERTIEFRHYSIKPVPVGMSKGVKKLVKAKIPNLNRYDDVSEFLLKGGELSESEAELDGPQNEVVLAQDLGTRGNIKSSKSAIRLVEIGPRLTLSLVKIEEGVCDGAVLYHQYKHLSAEEKLSVELRREQKKIAKDKRKKTQQENVKRKEEEKERLKELSLAGMKRKAESEGGEKDGKDDSHEEKEGEDDSGEPLETRVDSDDDDVAYFTQEVGEAPEKDLQLSTGHGAKRKRSDRPHLPFKKKRVSFDKGQTSTKGGFKGKQNGKAFDKFNKGKKGNKFEERNTFDKKGRKGDKFGKGSFDKKGKMGTGQKGFKGKAFKKGQKSGQGGRGRGKGRR